MEFIDITKLLCDMGVTVSRSQARRQISQGGVKVNGEIIQDISLEVPQESTVEAKQAGTWKVIQRKEDKCSSS